MKQFVLSFFLLICLSGIAQHQDKVDFVQGEVFIRPNPKQKDIKGSVDYKFKVLQNVDSVFLDAKKMGLESVTLDGKSIKVKTDENRITVFNKFIAGGNHELRIDFYAQPKQTLYFIGWEDSVKGNQQIWTQGQGKYKSHWLPSFDDMEEKVEFDLTIATKPGLNVIANGEYVYTSTTRNGDEDEWHFDMLEPMSSYLLAFAIGDYKKQELKSASGIPIENYYYPNDSLKVEPTYRYTKEIFDFLEKEIGVQYPWQNYKQVPVRDFLYAGMENTGTTIFSDQYVIDSSAFVDKNYVNVNAHEMAHQWFGNLVTEKSGEHHWLHEGFATYYAYLAEQHLFGDDHFYWKLFESLNQLKDQSEKGEGQSLLDPKASSLTFYEKGAWALFMLRNEVGDKAFKKGIKSYLEKFAFKNATINEFLKEMEVASGMDLADFRISWLEAKELQFEKARAVLSKKSSSLKLLSDMEADLKAAQSDDINYANYWDKSNSIHFKKHLLSQNQTSLPKEVFERALDSDTIPVRQGLIPGRDLSKFVTKENLESLLSDDSYVTKEGLLFTLWSKYPEEQIKYLEQTKEVIGLPNKNVRLIWLTLAMLTEGFETLKTKEYFDELSGYTNPEHSFEVRQGSFFYLNEAFGFNDQALANLIRATEHHSWQFRKFSRNLLDELLLDGDYKPRLEKVSKELKPEKSRYLLNKLNE